jgi:hypothetical protein
MNIAVHERTKLYECHIDSDSDDFRKIAAEIVFNEAGNLELKNKSKKTWRIINKQGKQVTKASGKTVPLEAGTQIIFGNTKGEVIV